jgi:acyl-[acyl-carrier-protein]-phospholipid O-acyltransferase/long-chain-fatty-acid--[acyl-carrier-protein] ligase
MQPDPTDARSVGRACARHKVTILCGAGTFMRLYVQSKAVHPLMFASLRLVVAGAEKLKPEVRQSFREKFGLEVYEGYGTTETTPVASTNLPDSLLDDFTVQVSNRPGTVGIPLPGSQFRIVDPDTLEALPIGEAGLILIGGTQIMKGYLDDPVRTASVVVEIDGKRWYKTGDKGRIDADGFLQILDRYSRFAKIGGEMVSLGLVEQAISEGGLLSPCEFVAVAVPDLGKGERIVLLYSAPEGQTAPEPETIRDRIRSCGMPPLSQPSLLFEVESVPHLGTGKADYGKAKELALSLAG